MKPDPKTDAAGVMALALNLIPAAIVLLAFVSGVYPGTARSAEALAPDTMVKTTVNEVLEVIRHSKDKRALRQLAEQKVLPKFDFKEMTRLAVGPAWKNANPAQQQSLENGFRTLLVNTYTSALSSKSSGDSSVEVKPAQAPSNQGEVTVRTVVRQGGRPPLPIDYRMNSAQDGWKVFDVLVDGISLVTNYRGEFAEEVRKSGIDGLIRALDSKNQRSAAG